MSVRDFHCKRCDHVFQAQATEGVAESLLLAACPKCRVPAALYKLAKPLFIKPVSEWGLGEWGIAALLGFVTYKAATDKKFATSLASFLL
jgi:hypothetical protein